MKRLLLVSIGLLAACAPKPKTTFQAKPDALDKITCVAVLPFESLGDDNPGSGDAFADLLATEMMRSGRFQVMDRAESGRILAARGIYLAATVDAETARALGDVLGVQAVLVGAVSEYGFKVPAYDDRNPRPLVSVTTRLLDVKTGDPLWGTSFSGSPTTFFGDPTPPMSVAAQRVALDISDSLAGSSGAVRELSGKPCWDAKAQSVLATLAPGQGPGRPSTPVPTPVATAVAMSTPVPVATVAPTPEPTPVFVAVNTTPKKKLTPAQTALRTKMAPAGQFILEGIAFSTPTGTQLAPVSSAPLSDLAAVLLNHPEAKLRIEGHVDPTDAGPVPLSQKRAEAVVAKLQSLGVVAGQVEPKGMGGSKSLFPSFVEAMKAKNRRIEIAVISPPTDDAAVAVATPAGTPAATPVATPAGTANARVKVLASKGKSAQAVKLANELKQAGTKITTIANVPEARTATLIYFTAPFEKEAQKLAKQIPVPGGAKMTAYKTLGAGVDIVIVVGSDLK